MSECHRNHLCASIEAMSCVGPLTIRRPQSEGYEINWLTSEDQRWDANADTIHDALLMAVEKWRVNKDEQMESLIDLEEENKRLARRVVMLEAIVDCQNNSTSSRVLSVTIERDEARQVAAHILAMALRREQISVTSLIRQWPWIDDQEDIKC